MNRFARSQKGRAINSIEIETGHARALRKFSADYLKQMDTAKATPSGDRDRMSAPDQQWPICCCQECLPSQAGYIG
jgi:hypothetical protein